MMRVSSTAHAFSAHLGIAQPGKPHLLARFSQLGAVRPFGPGEYLDNPDGSWSSERTVTVENPALNGGRPSVIPGLWIVNGAPVQLADDQAAEVAARSGLTFLSFDTTAEAEKFANAREAKWQTVRPGDSGAQPPLWAVAAGRGLLRNGTSTR